MTRRYEPTPLPPGNWRLDPFTRVLRYVYDDPATVEPDAFDEPEPEPDRGPTGRALKPIEHGTPAGARAHARRGDNACRDCQRAQTDYRRKLRLQKAAKGDPRYVCECGALKHRRSKHCDPCARHIRALESYGKDAA